MIPLFSYTNLISGVIATVLGMRLYVRHQRAVTPLSGVRYFLVFYGLLAAVFFLYATPGLVFKNVKLILFTQSLADVLVYLSSMVLILISFYALNRQTTGALLCLVIGTAALAYLVSRMFNAIPPREIILPPYIYWQTQEPFWMQAMTGIVAGIGSVLFVITFTILGFRFRANKDVFRRSLLMAVGMACLSLASLTFWVFATGGFGLALVSSLLAAAGLLLMLRGIPDKNTQHLTASLQKSSS